MRKSHTSLLILLLIVSLFALPIEGAGAASEVASFQILAPSQGMTVGMPLGLLVLAEDSKGDHVETFTGTVNFRVSMGTVTPTTSGAFAQGFWRGSLNISLADKIGNNDAITVYVDDGNGHTGQSYPIPIHLPYPPKISLLSPLNRTYNGSFVSLVFSVDKSANWTGYSLDRKPSVTITGNASLTGLSNGTHTLVVYANDTFGSMGTSERISFTVAIPEPGVPEPEIPSEPFPVVPVASAVVAIAIVGLLVYFKKRKR